MRSLPVRDWSCTSLPTLRATQRSPSNLRSSSQSPPKSRRSVKVASMSGITMSSSFHVDVEGRTWLRRASPVVFGVLAHPAVERSSDGSLAIPGRSPSSGTLRRDTPLTGPAGKCDESNEAGHSHDHRRHEKPQIHARDETTSSG